MKKIYLVTRGYYTTYCICGAYSSKRLAKKMKKYFGDETEVEEWPLDITWPKRRKRFYISMKRNGHIEEITTDKPFSIFDFMKEVEVEDGIDESWIFLIWAKNEKHAKKVAENWRRKLLLMEGPEGKKLIRSRGKILWGRKGR